jgi:hypothetical protein
MALTDLGRPNTTAPGVIFATSTWTRAVSSPTVHLIHPVFRRAALLKLIEDESSPLLRVVTRDTDALATSGRYRKYMDGNLD